ncbi:MAG: type IV pilin protein [Halioglobus sp.]
MSIERKKVRGFTLNELMIVVVIVSVLLAVALPAYQNQVLKTKRSLARGELLEVLGRQEQYFVNNKAYATDLTNLGYPANGYYVDADSNESATSGGSIYLIRFTASPVATALAFTMEAVPQGGQTKDTRCSTLSITSVGLKASSTGTTEECW